MLLLIEIFDTITGILVLTESCLVLFGVELGLIVPKLQHLDVHCWVKVQCQTSGAPLKSVWVLHQPSSTASEISSNSRPSRLLVMAWVALVLVRPGIVEK
jgi:hypothetical protein